MAARAPSLLQGRLNQIRFVILGLLVPSTSYVARALVAPRVRSTPRRWTMMTTRSGERADARRPTSSLSYNVCNDHSRSFECRSKASSRRPRGKQRKRSGRGAKLFKSLALSSSVVAPLLLAIEPASAAAPGILAGAVAELLRAVAPPSSSSSAPSYHLTRILFLRLLAVVYTAAFSVAKFQNRGLIGDRGITPARHVLDTAQRRGEAKSARRREWLEERKHYSGQNSTSLNFFVRCKHRISDSAPAEAFRDKFWHRADRMDRPLLTLLWFARDRSQLNPWLDGLANAGLFLSTLVLATGSANVPIIFGLWLIQRSFMSVGGPFYGYGWEPQLAELTFHALFLVPLLSMNPFFGSNVATATGAAAVGNGVMGAYPVPTLVIWAVRWYLFKIMIGAGLIKAKSSDPKWKPGNMSAMDYFYETQPVPNQFTRYFHFMPKAWHRFEVWMNHFVELVAPFLLLMPLRRWRLTGGLIQIMFQLVLISSGNLSFLNWLTIVPAIFCFDDAFLVNNVPAIGQKIALGTPATHSHIQSFTSGALDATQTPLIRTIISTLFFLFMAKLNLKVVQNLLARSQVMNGSFDKLRLVGTYGAFGVVAEQRHELIIESANDINGPWREYHFKVKPGDVHRRPSWISPYHHRIDWQMWIASQIGRIERSPWIPKLLLKLLRQEKDVVDLLERDPWSSTPEMPCPAANGESETGDGSNAPKYIRIDKYRYSFYKSGNATDTIGHEGMTPYWIREKVGRYFPRQGVMTADMLEKVVNSR